MDLYCVHAYLDAPKTHAKDQLEKFGLEPRCVHMEPGHYSDAHPDLRRQFVHMEAIKTACASGRGGIFVEADAVVSKNPLKYSAGPPGIDWDILCMSGSVTSMHFYRRNSWPNAPYMQSFAETTEDLERDLKMQDLIVLGPTGSTSLLPIGISAVLEDGRVKALRFSKDLYEAVVKRGPVTVNPESDLKTELYERMQEITYVNEVGSGRPDPSPRALQRRKWIRANPTTLSCYALASAKAARKALDLLLYTTSKSPLPNVLSYEKHTTEDRLLCYMLAEPICSTDFDDIVDYIHVLSGVRPEFPLSRKPVSIRSAKMAPDNQSVYLGVLPESELPKVSILTITRNRRRIFNIATYMVLNTQYPKDRLEWVIVDDSEEGEDCLPALGSLRKDPRVVYRRLKTENGKPFRIGHKREISCQLATGDVFVHLDDDDFLPPMGVMVRVRALLEYKARCMGATYMLSHVYENGRTFFTTVADAYGDLVCFGEPSMAYTRDFWEERRWNEKVHMDEGRYFLLGRDYSEFVDVPSHFHCVALTHSKNVTGTLRDGTNILAAANLNKTDVFPKDLIRLMDSVFEKKK